MKIKRILCLFFALLMLTAPTTLTSCTTSIEHGEQPKILQPFKGEPLSRSVYVAELESGEKLYGLNETDRMNAASTVKIMTALLTIEYIAETENSAKILDEYVTIPEYLFDKFDTDDPNTIGGSMAGFKTGQDNVTYRDCLYGLMLPSGNDAANVLAYNIGGDIDTFVAMMNKRALELGCIGSNFTNAHGLLEERNYSCAFDLAVIMRYAYNNHALFRKICGTEQYALPNNGNYGEGGYYVKNSNALIRKEADNIYYRDFVKGGKNGALDYIYYKDGDGNWVEHNGIANLISVGEIDKKLYVIVTLEAPYLYGELNLGVSRLNDSYVDHINLYDWLKG